MTIKYNKNDIDENLIPYSGNKNTNHCDRNITNVYTITG